LLVIVASFSDRELKERSGGERGDQCVDRRVERVCWRISQVNYKRGGLTWEDSVSDEIIYVPTQQNSSRNSNFIQVNNGVEDTSS
jgi:TnpA family transposase